MPIPKPRKGETVRDFISRCAGDATMNADYPKAPQRVAVCYSAYREAHPGAAKPPKAVAPAACYPQPDESRGEFMDRCTSGGDSEGACVMAWETRKALPATVERDVQIKWMPTLLEFKGLNEGERTIMGIATTPSIDHVGDIVESLGAKFKLPVPLLLGHRHDQVVGSVTYATPNDKGIPFQARIAKIDEPGRLKDRCDEAWQSVKAGLIKGVSIGFTPIKDKYEMIKGGGIRFKEWTWHELSLVVVPAQSEATIQVIRSLDAQALRAATGQTQDERVSKTPAGVTARATASKPEAQMATKTIAESIAAYASTRVAHAARQDELMSKANDEGITLSEEDASEYDELEDKIAAIDEHLKRLRKQEKRNIDMAVAVDGDMVGRNASSRLERPRVAASIKPPPLEKGFAFCRYIAAVAMAKGNLFEAAQIGRRDAWRDTPEVANVLDFVSREGTTQITKTAINPATTFGAGDVQGTANWADPLVQLTYMAGEFIDYLRGQTILDKISGGMRKVPFNVRIPLQSGGSTGYWVGEGSSKPMSEAAFSTTTMTFAKVAALCAFTNEALRFSNPGLEAMIRQDMSDALAYRLDVDFLDPTKTVGTGTGGPSPASVTNGVTQVTATGTTMTTAYADLATVLTNVAILNLDPSGGVWIMHPSQAIQFSLALNTLGNREFPNITPDGGSLLGFRVVTSTNVPSSGGSPTDGYMVAFVIPSEILLADDGNVTIDASNQASLQFNTAPDSPATASTVYRSLWQENMTALLAERYITWKKRRTGVVQYIDYAKYKA
jgi:HK97 family phage major capsid protein/HK97 family phage prohead protease